MKSMFLHAAERLATHHSARASNLPNAVVSILLDYKSTNDDEWLADLSRSESVLYILFVGHAEETARG